MTDVYENRIKDVEVKFCHEQEVQIVKGFYRGNIGVITGYTIKENKIYYNLNIDKLNLILIVDENDLQEIKHKSFIKKLLR